MHTQGVRRFQLLLSPDEVDLTQPIAVTINGIESFNDRVQPDIGTLLEWSVQVGFDVVFDSGSAEGAPHFVVDVDANGAPDVVRLRTEPDDSVVLEVARARYGYHWSVDYARTAATGTPTSDGGVTDGGTCGSCSFTRRGGCSSIQGSLPSCSQRR